MTSEDLQTLLNLINVIQAEFKDSRGRASVVELGGRVTLAALNSSLTIMNLDSLRMPDPNPDKSDGHGLPNSDGDGYPDGDGDQKSGGDDDTNPDGDGVSDADGAIPSPNSADLDSNSETQAERSNGPGGDGGVKVVSEAL